ncbi:MAG: transposase, partial [Clostridia bacterium]|nr:transposase [Clostridia bacterium]
FHKLDDAAREIDSRLSRMTVPTAIGELEKIEIIRYNEQPYRLDHAVTATQKMLLKAFDLSEDDVLGELKHVNDVLIGAKT